MTEMTLSDRLLAVLKGTYKPGDTMTAHDVKGMFEDVDLHTLQNTFWMLSKKGFLDKPRGKGTRGVYVLRGRKAPKSQPLAPKNLRVARRKSVVPRGKRTAGDPEQVIIDELLDCMARAEPILKKWSAIREALKGI